VSHVLTRRVRVHSTDLARRQLLRSGVLVGGSGLLYVAIEGVVRALSLSGAERRGTGSYETGSLHPGRMPVTQWLNDRVPFVDATTWRLHVGASGEGRLLAYDDLTRYEDRLRAIIDCTGGWWAEQDWEGVWLSTLLGPIEGRSITVSSVTGYGRRFPVRDAHRLLLATRAGGAPLSAGHGAPVRLVAPGRRGFWWVKWIDSIDVDDRPWWLQAPFPLT
jgi:DMSO/TMAO reductase YedYZ molybdopterin-dependent catalytic subunit